MARVLTGRALPPEARRCQRCGRVFLNPRLPVPGRVFCSDACQQNSRVPCRYVPTPTPTERETLLRAHRAYLAAQYPSAGPARG